MKLTDELIEKSNGMISLHDEINDWTGKHYKMFDDGGVELETGEFLYGMVRVLKPNLILETGTYTGISAMYMAQGLKDNGAMGKLISLEIDQSHKSRAEKLWHLTGLAAYAYCNLRSSEDFAISEQYDFMFLDSEPILRFSELVRFYPFLKPGGFVFLHDLHRHMGQGQPKNPDHPEMSNWPWGDLPKEIKFWVQTDALRPIHFPTPRGLMGFYKPTEDDYKWK